MRIKLPACMDNMVATVAQLIMEHRAICKWRAIHPGAGVTRYDHTKLLPRMPDHTHWPYTDIDWNDFPRAEQAFAAVSEVRFRRSR